VAALDRIAPAEGVGGREGIVRAIGALGRIARHRGMVAIVSDLPLAPGLEQAIGALGRRHEVVAIEVRDPRERDFPDVGPVTLRDMETGRRRLVDTSDPRFRSRFAATVEATDRARVALLARAGARHVIVQTDRDWVVALARSLSMPARRREAVTR
jgi:hypothetical protein